MGIARAGAADQTVLLTGLAGLVTGACSMALGEWLSVTNARELAQTQITRKTEELEQTPMAEQHELALIFQAKGMPKCLVLLSLRDSVTRGLGRCPLWFVPVLDHETLDPPKFFDVPRHQDSARSEGGSGNQHVDRANRFPHLIESCSDLTGNARAIVIERKNRGRRKKALELFGATRGIVQPCNAIP